MVNTARVRAVCAQQRPIALLVFATIKIANQIAQKTNLVGHVWQITSIVSATMEYVKTHFLVGRFGS